MCKTIDFIDRCGQKYPSRYCWLQFQFLMVRGIDIIVLNFTALATPIKENIEHEYKRVVTYSWDSLLVWKHVRNNYVREFVSDYECLLMNNEWRCLPTVCIDSNNVPVVLTCRNHHKGSKKMMLHTSRASKHILPSMYADQLAHAVIQCRTVQPMRKTKYI